jgi:hypothetical protein
MARPDTRDGPAVTPSRPHHAAFTATAEQQQGLDAARVLAAALAYAAAGWPVFPCQIGGKAPLTGHGFKNASTAEPVIRAWWDRWPDANLAIATGQPGPDVLDVDQREDGDGWAALNRLTRAGLVTGARAIVRTPGGGLHVYFAGTGQRCGSLPRHHLDFKAAGGYVLAPPSSVHGRPYTLLDHRAGIAGLDWQAVRRLLDPPSLRPRPRGRGSAAALAAWVARLPEGDRNAGLFWAACRAADSGQDPGPLVAAAIGAGLGEPEARRTVASAIRKAATP